MADKDTLIWLFRRPIKTMVAWLAAAKPQPFPSGVERILVIREGGYGDLILTMPVIRSLREHVGPNVTIDLLVREEVAAMMADNGVTANLCTKCSNVFRALARIRAMRKRRYQVIIDLVSSPSLSFALWIWAIAPRAHRIGGDKAELRGMYHQHTDLPPRPAIHFMERLRRIMAFATDNAPVCDQVPWFAWPESVRTTADNVWRETVTGRSNQSDIGRPDTLVRPSPDSPVPKRGAGLVVLVNLSAGLPRRTWPDKSYRELLSALVPRYEDKVHRWIITASPGDQPRAAELAAAINRREVMIFPPQSDFRVLCELTGRVDLVLTPDTSFVHAASAAGVPVVAFTVAENVISWAPWKIPCEVVAAPEGEPVSAIPVHKVEAAFDQMMSKLRSTSP